MDKITERLKACIDAHPFGPGDSNCETVLDHLYQAYAESLKSGFRTVKHQSGVRYSKNKT